MYHPYFRGKQFELITIRETATLMAGAGFVPIIEPVRESLGGLERALSAVCDADGHAVVIVNPYHGDHSEDGTGISELLQTGYLGSASIGVGVLLRQDMSLAEAMACCTNHKDHKLTLVHAGFTHGKALAEALIGHEAIERNVFIEGKLTKLYTRNFKMGLRVLVRDGFNKQRNLACCRFC